MILASKVFLLMIYFYDKVLCTGISIRLRTTKLHEWRNDERRYNSYELAKPSDKMIGIVVNPTFQGRAWQIYYISASQGTDSFHAIIRSYRWAFTWHSKSVARHNLVHVVGYAKREILPQPLRLIWWHHCRGERCIQRRSRQE